uniref:Uncharacterized protein n=1 Tax=Caenorhabditis tropicalis TaxID=1561998 RepID=A0A1I7UZC3_9PELO
MGSAETDGSNHIDERRTAELILLRLLHQPSGSYTLPCPLPSQSTTTINAERNDLYLFHLQFDGTSNRVKCSRMTPIPGVLYPVYRKILDEFRDARNQAARRTRKVRRFFGILEKYEEKNRAFVGHFKTAFGPMIVFEPYKPRI